MTARLFLSLVLATSPVLLAAQGVSPSSSPGTQTSASPSAPPSGQMDSGSQLSPAPNGASPVVGGQPTSTPTHSASKKWSLATLQHTDFVGMLLAHKADLQLAAKQITALNTLEQNFQIQTDTASRQLDSLRKANGHFAKGFSLRNPSLSSAQIKTLMQSQQTMQALATRINAVQEQAKQRALTLLTPAQKTQAEVLEQQMRQMINSTLHTKIPSGKNS